MHARASKDSPTRSVAVLIVLGADVDAVAIVRVGLFAISVCADNTSYNTK